MSRKHMYILATMSAGFRSYGWGLKRVAEMALMSWSMLMSWGRAAAQDGEKGHCNCVARSARIVHMQREQAVA